MKQEDMCPSLYFVYNDKTYYACDLKKGHKGKHRRVKKIEWDDNQQED